MGVIMINCRINRISQTYDNKVKEHRPPKILPSCSAFKIKIILPIKLVRVEQLPILLIYICKIFKATKTL